MKAIIVLLLTAAACSAGFHAPSDALTEKALQTTWEGSYGMEKESRPTKIVWWAPGGCGEDKSVTGITLRDYCSTSEETSSGTVYIRWQGSFHDSDWTLALASWKAFLMTGEWVNSSTLEEDAVEANRDLESAGL